VAAAIAVASGAHRAPGEPAELVAIDVCVPTPGHPRHDHQVIFPLADGRLLLVWSEYYVPRDARDGAIRSQTDDRPCRIAAKVSSDGGRTWGGAYVFQENTGRLNVKQPNLLRLPSGEVLFFYTEWNSLEDRAVFVRRSADDCRTWSKPLRVSAATGITNITNDRVMTLGTGRVLLPAFSSPTLGAGQHFQAFCFYSDDAGRHWQASEQKIDLPARGAEEPSMVELGDGRLLAMLRTSLGSVYKSYSEDGGQRWSAPTSTGLPAPASPPLVKRIPSTGNLLLVWNRNYEPGHHHQGERRPLSAAISRDEGDSWVHLRDIEAAGSGAAAYAAVTFRGGEALVTYYYQARGFGGASGIRLRILPVAWFGD
jgi:sialidase-1